MILVTGASGIVGHFVVKTLLEQGHKVRATRRAGSNLERLAAYQDNLEWVEADVLDVTALNKAYEGVERVVHCAALVSFHQEDKKAMMAVNVEGTANMVNLALEHGVKKFVHVSSVAALGRKPGIDVIDENIAWEESDNNTNYAKSKHLGEMEVWRAHAEGLPVAIVNPSIVLGPGDWNSSSMQLFKYVKQGRMFYPAGTMNYVDVRDVAQIILLLLFNDINGERFILNAGKAPYREVFALISKYLNKPAPKIKVNTTLLTFAYVVDTIRAKLTGSRAIVTRESINLSRMDYLFDNKKVKEALHYEFRTLEDSIAWTCERILLLNK